MRNYEQVVAALPRLFSQLEGPSLRHIYLKFDIEKVYESPESFVDHVKSIGAATEGYVIGQRYPRLEMMSFDVGAAEGSIPWWQSRFQECFPQLTENGLLDVVHPAHLIEL